MAVPQHGSAKTVEELRVIAEGIGRPVRERRTDCAQAGGWPERIAVGDAAALSGRESWSGRCTRAGRCDLSKGLTLMDDFWDFFWLLVWSFVFVAYLILLFQILTDLFRDRLSGC